MTKDYFIQMAEYNVWANTIAHSWLNSISEEQWNQPITSSFGNISATVLHVAGAETIWLERLNGTVDPAWLPSRFKGGKKETLELWQGASVNMKSFMESFDESRLNDILFFKRLNGQPYEMPVYQVLAHVFNHSTFHRGQLVLMLRQVGFTDLQSTDMSTFFNQLKSEYGNS